MASKTTQNQNQITRWSVMLGVNPGYDNTVYFTPDLAIQKAIPFINTKEMKTKLTLEAKVSGFEYLIYDY